MISASRSGRRRRRARRGRRSEVHSGMVDSRNETHRVDEDPPGVALAAKDVSAFARKRVEAAPALAGLLHPPALEPAAFFESVQQRIERGDVELQLLRSEEHTSELQSRGHLVCRLLLEKKKPREQLFCIFEARRTPMRA